MHAWSSRNKKAVIHLPFSRGKRLSILAVLDCNGFVAWEATEGTFNRANFHAAIVRKLVPLLNPWPLPRSIVVLDNAKIHLYKELETIIHQCGARLIYLPPYSPQLNPIEVCFGNLKRWIQKHANLVFPLYPSTVLDLAMVRCISSKDDTCRNLYSHCGYSESELRESTFRSLINREREED
jgi:transposase